MNDGDNRMIDDAIDEWLQTTSDETFRATHEIGHVIMAEKLGIPWTFATIESENDKIGGQVNTEELECKEQNAEKHIWVKMAGKALLLNRGFDEYLARQSAKIDLEDIVNFYHQLYPKFNKFIDEHSLSAITTNAVEQMQEYMNQEHIVKLIDLVIPELVKRKRITREEYLRLKDSIK